MIQQLKTILNRGNLLTGFIISLLLTVILGFSATPALATGVYQVPALSSGDQTWVVELDGVLSRHTQGRLNNSLSELAEKTGYEVRFLTIRRLDYGETIESFTEKVFKKWFPNPEVAANQTLLVLDLLTNNGAIQTGEKTKSLLTDEIAKSVVEQTLKYPLRKGDKYNEAFIAASDRISTILSGEPDPGPPIEQDNINVDSTFKSAEETDDVSATIIVLVLLVVATVVPMATYYYFQGNRS
ncbi:MAG TPA: beta-propeller domain-containing protein, methanol dehydrogenase [Planktothrix sp. UBA8407]|jgi:Beta-propeller domains of methanol dehydrogenase type|nr:beta-propeller domain-containing protein, methanol dehydrogenase [Planktothrix sp. UBA8402]HAO11112.1 beta-propeller domain-containing protein, methanol dehydrogenase [Planktothrix sp. UBA8407]HBK23287.1 beta-propeller domain-containing protein, methanol dehydrogenase [Planktothrix sp. UBA10369]